jgi:hypothetical protein
MVLVQSPDGQELREVPASSADWYVKNGGRVVPQGKQSAQPTTPAAPQGAAPQAAAAPAGWSAPPSAEVQVMMQNKYGDVKRATTVEEVKRLEGRGWKALPPTDPYAHLRDMAGQPGRDMWRDLTVGAPRRQPATPRK